MLGKHVSNATDELCRRCKDNISVLVVRSEPLCHDCFARYVHTKAIKRLESFRVNFAASQDEQRRVLLPLSFGVSSTTLLHILDLHLKTQQAKTGRTGFAVNVVFVDCGNETMAVEEQIHRTETQYPDHRYASLSLHQIFSSVQENDPLYSLLPFSDHSQMLDSQDQLAQLINSLTSATARADVVSTLRTRLIIEHAKKTGCGSIMWGHSTTRLAEETLAETAKGRGFSLPWQLSDGLSPFGINFHYPLRDVLKKELVSYIDLAEPSLSKLVLESTGPTQASTSSKNTTIDDLMKQYFESVELNFPSIVSNVVRTAGKLERPVGASSDPTCSLCGMPVPGGHFGIHGWGGDQHHEIQSASAEASNYLCYGCTRSIPPTVMRPKFT